MKSAWPLRSGVLTCAVVATLHPSAAPAQTLDDVVISASRSEQRIFDAPGSIDAVSRERIERSGPQINISESLGYVPGINVANRNNYAQDLQISIRGFGSRAPFGVRGVRLMIDGLPQSLPDGQGQTSQFASTSADRLEVLRGPLAALYGNASGGVIQAFTREPTVHPELDITGYAGADDLYRTSIQYSETRGPYGFVLDYGALSSGGFREYSAAERHHVNAKLVNKSDTATTTFILNGLNQAKSEDPGSRTLGEFQTDPYGANSGNLQYKAGKKFVQTLAGVVHETGNASRGVLTSRAYVATRDLDNPGRAASVWFLIDRLQYGVGSDYQAPFVLGSLPGKLSLGAEADQVIDQRRQRSNTNGVMGTTDTRNEDNIASNIGVYARGDWFLSESLSLTTGVRLSQVRLQVKDHLTNGTGSSGSRTYSGISPVIGLVRHLSPEQNLYINIGQSFETPTLNEVLYTPGAGTSSTNQFYGLNPAKAYQAEIGWKWRAAEKGALTASAFFTRTRDDIVPELVSASGATWQNADTERKGLEFSAFWKWNQNLSSAANLTLLQAHYREALAIRGSAGFGATVTGGDRLPNIPNDRVQLELRYRSSDMVTKDLPRFRSAVELVSVGKIYVRSNNSESTDRYTLLNLSLAATTTVATGTVTAYARIDNVTDKLYAASTIADQEAGRYYEPGAPRNWLVGLKYTRPM